VNVLHSRLMGDWDLASLLEGIWDDAPPLPISGLAIDSREVQRGSVFIALKGAALDGRDFLPQAAAAGAVAALVDGNLPVISSSLPMHAVASLRERVGGIASRFYAHPSRALHIAAVTGTNGKTTVSHLLAQLVRAGGYDCGVIGTLGCSLDGAAQSSLHTTPDAIALHRTLADWVAGAVPFVSMEASSHALDQARLNAVEIDTAIFTNLTRDHLDYHGDMGAYGAAKARLFQQPGLRTAVLNADDPFAAQLAAQLPAGVDCLRYGIDSAEAELRLTALEVDENGFRARLHSPWGRASLRCPLLGRFNASNLAAALGAALTAGLPLEATVEAVASLTPVAGRMEPVRGSNAPLVVIDYAHTPDALAQVLATLRPQTSGRLTTVFGCGGDRDRGKRAAMAQAVSELADSAVITSDNPRGEDPLEIIRDIEAGMTGSYQSIPDRAVAISRTIANAGPSDCILIAGKGHEDYQIVGERRLPFSDRDAARHALAERGQ
jgi:UDP-N-acetylmuramoyl-L-alanyl-D-glutamate--2,6-diaminopimelate ligase